MSWYTNLAVIVLIDSLGLNPGFVLTPLARSAPVVASWYAMPDSTRSRIDGYILSVSADSVTFAPVDTAVGASTTQLELILPPIGHWVTIQTWYDGDQVSDPSPPVWLPPVQSFIRRFRAAHPSGSPPPVQLFLGPAVPISPIGG